MKIGCCIAKDAPSLVLKQAWHYEGEPTEKELSPLTLENVADIICSVKLNAIVGPESTSADVMLRDGTRCIRRGLHGAAYVWEELTCGRMA